MYMRVGSPAQAGSVVAYARCAAQDADGEALQKQKVRVLELAAAHGLEIKPENIIADYGSGATAERPGLASLLTQIESGGASVLVVTRLDRLWRSTRAGGHLSDALVAHGVTVVTTDHTFCLDQAEDAAQWRWCCMPPRAVGGRAARMRRG